MFGVTTLNSNLCVNTNSNGHFMRGSANSYYHIGVCETYKQYEEGSRAIYSPFESYTQKGLSLILS